MGGPPSASGPPKVITMIYVAFTVWVVLSLFAAAGVYRLWSQLARPEWVNWALLPGTVVSEMSYMLGVLITGGEVRRARLIDLPKVSGRKRRRSQGEPKSESVPRFRIVGPIDGVLVSIAACCAVIAIAAALLGRPVLVTFITDDGLLPTALLPKTLATNWGMFWDHMGGQVHLLRRMCETWGRVDWLNWRVPLFMYLSICLSVRLAPVNRPMRTTLLAAAMLAGVVAVVGAISSVSGGSLMDRIWPVLTYVWTMLLFLLAVTLLIKGAVSLVSALIGESTD